MVGRVGDLELEQDLSFEKKEWIFQWIGRGFMALVVIAALLGFFGAGPFSLTEVRDPTGDLSVTYEHFGRRGATTNLVVELSPQATSNGEGVVWFSTEYMEKFQRDGITPARDKVTLTDDGYEYTFLVGDEEGTTSITYNFTIEAMGPESGLVSLKDGAPVELWHFFAP